MRCLGDIGHMSCVISAVLTVVSHYNAVYKPQGQLPAATLTLFNNKGNLETRFCCNILREISEKY